MDGLEEERGDQVHTVLMPVSHDRRVNLGSDRRDRNEVNSALGEKEMCTSGSRGLVFFLCRENEVLDTLSLR